MTSIISKWPTGSRYICTPAVLNTDDDYVVLAKQGWSKELEDKGFTYTPTDVEYDSMGEFTSVRKGDINYIVTENPVFFERFRAATELAKTLNLQNKNERVRLFQLVLYGVT